MMGTDFDLTQAVTVRKLVCLPESVKSELAPSAQIPPSVLGRPSAFSVAWITVELDVTREPSAGTSVAHWYIQLI